MDLSAKKEIHQLSLETLAVKKQRLEKQILDAQQAAAEDTKSSAGDKYETSREMMKQEINKANQQLAILEKMEEVLMKVPLDQKKNEVGLGSLVECNEGIYFFSVSLGQIKWKGKSVYLLSLAAPLGKMLVGKKEGEKLDFRGRDIEIQSIY
ncbi:MAG: 3-oxoacyl-ACP synthase [Bacteroidota bacterium]